MEMKGKFSCCSPVSLVFAGDLGHAQRRSWTSSLGSLASAFSTYMRIERGLKIILSSPLALGSSHTSSLILIMDFLLHLHESLIMIKPPITHQPGAITSVGIDLHLGQKPKLGGRYTDNSLIYTSYFVGTLYIHVLLSFSLIVVVLISAFQNTKKTKNNSVVSLCLPL
jgi:hypothetical protein